MADIQVKIKLNVDVSGDSIKTVDFSQTTNNVSKPEGTTTSKNDGQNLISWGEYGIISLSDGYVGGVDATLGKQGGYNGFVFGVVPDSKYYSVEVTLEGENIDSVVVYGDKTANQFPTRAYLDGDESNYIYSDDVEWAIVFPTASNTHTITFDMWNRANYNACITHIAVATGELFIDKHVLKEVSSISQTTGDSDGINYGVLANSGSFNVVDTNNKIQQYIENGVIDVSNLPVTVIANNKNLQTHFANNATYDPESKTFDFKLTNSLANWDEVVFGGYPYKDGGENAYNIMFYVLESVGIESNEINEMLSNKIVYGEENYYGTVKSYLQKIHVKYPYLQRDTLRNTIEKFCVLAQLNVYKDDNDKIKFVSARPVESKDLAESAMVIGNKNIVGVYDKDLIVKNKYKVVNVNETKVSDGIKYGDVIGEFSSTDIETEFDIQTDFVEKTGFDYNVGSGFTYSVAYVSSLAEYFVGQFTVKKKNDQNLEEINSILFGKNDNGEDNIKCTITYIPYTSNATAKCSVTNSVGSKTASVDNIQKGKMSIGVQESTSRLDLNISRTEKYDMTSATATIQEGVDITNFTNLSTISLGDSLSGIVDNGDSYTYYFKVLAHKETVSLGFGDFTTAGAGTYVNDMTGERKLLRAVQIEINFYGNKRVISFEDNSYSDVSNDHIKNSITIASNELLQDGTIYNQKMKVSELISSNIKKDYANGVRTARIKSPCIDMYTQNGDKIKDWSKGETIRTNDIVHTQKDNMFWKVTGSTFEKSGVPMVSSELQEITQFVDTIEEKTYTLSLPTGLDYINYEIISNDGNIYSQSANVVEGSSLTFNVSVKDYYKNNAKIERLYINGNEIKNGDTVIVDKDLTLTFDFSSVTYKEKVVQVSDGSTYNIPYNIENYDIVGDVKVVYVAEYDSTEGVILGGYSQSTSVFSNLTEEYQSGYYSNSGKGSFDITINKNYCKLVVPSNRFPTSDSMNNKYVGLEYNVWQEYNSGDFA